MQLAGVVGLPRSGTTWVAKIIDSSPVTAYLHEPDYVRGLHCVPLVADQEDADVWAEYLHDFIHELAKSGAARSLLKRPQFQKRYRNTWMQRTSFELASLTYRGRQLLAATGFDLHGTALPRDYKNASLLVWKSVEMVGRLGVLARVLRDQKFVFVVRHPCGFVDSVLRGEQSGKFEGSSVLSKDAGMFAAAMSTPFARSQNWEVKDWLQLSPIEKLSRFWCSINEQAWRDTSAMSNVLLVQYEQLCRSPEAETKRIFDFLGLDVEPQTAQFLKESTTTNSTDYYSVSRNTEDKIEDWKRSLSTSQIESILAQTHGTKIAKSLQL